MNSRKLTFENARSEKLAARLDLPSKGKPVAFALFAHCFTCSKNLRAVGNISRALAERGIAVLRFDFTGLGESEGDFADTNFSSNVDDLVAAADFLDSEHQAPKILIGHSLGGAAVLQAASQISSAEAIATIAAPCHPQHVERLLTGAKEKIASEGEAEVEIAGRKFKIKKQFLEDLEQTSMEDKISKLKKPLMIFHSPFDNIVGIDNAETIFRAAKHPKSFVSLDQADHLLSDPQDSAYAGAVIAAWASKYLSQTETETTSSRENEVIVHTGSEGYASEIQVANHQLISDEPESHGGTDLGPSPYDLLVAGLGACTGMTLRMYADRKKWPLTGITVRLNHDKIHASDCEQCETESGKIDKITRAISLEGELDEDQRKRLIEIANKCPVHRTLHSEILVETKEA